jgi:hypothetical protein
MAKFVPNTPEREITLALSLPELATIVASMASDTDTIAENAKEINFRGSLADDCDLYAQLKDIYYEQGGS